MNYTYIVECSDRTLYTGWTTDLEHRVRMHNEKKGAKYTRSRLPVKLVYCEEYATKKEAMQREYAIKQMTRGQKLQLMAPQNALKQGNILLEESRKMRVGLAQTDIVWEEISANEEKAKHFFEEAKKQAVDILVFPEMSFTGFTMNVERFRHASQGQVEFMQAMTREYKMTAVFGYLEAIPPIICQDIACQNDICQDTAFPNIACQEKEENALAKNSMLCEEERKNQKKEFRNMLSIIEDGVVKMSYQKIHPFTFGMEGEHFVGGEDVRCLRWRDTILGGFICYDVRFPEIFQMSSKYSDVIFVIANWPSSRSDQWDALLRARAIENQCYIVAVNRTGDGGGLHYDGHSAVYSPKGELMTQITEKEALIVCDIDLSVLPHMHERFPVKKDRRPEIYQKAVDIV